MKNYLKDNCVEMDNVSIVIFALYFIILANFRREEYKSLFIENREETYKNLTLLYRKTGR